MVAWRDLLVLSLSVLLGFGCQPPGANDPSQAAVAGSGLPGVDTNSLTRAERDIWAELVTEQLAPCPSVPKSIADCIRQNAACNACLPAAQQMAQQIRRGKSKSQAEVAYRARFTESGLVQVELDGSPSKGPEQAPVTIVEWADFECGFCAKAAPLFDEVLEAYPNQLRMVFKHFPLELHPHATEMARLAIAAGNQGKFWEMHRAMFAVQGGQLDQTGILKLAERFQLDPEKLVTDMQSASATDRLARDRAQADRLGLKGTPFIVINSRRFDFAAFDLEEDLRNWIDVELQLVGKTGK